MVILQHGGHGKTDVVIARESGRSCRWRIVVLADFCVVWVAELCLNFTFPCNVPALEQTSICLKNLLLELTGLGMKTRICSRSAPGSPPALTNFRACRPQGLFLLRHCSPTLTAVLVDAGFFLKRAERIYGHQSPETTAKQLHRIALDHLNDDQGHRIARLYRIFVYDAPPAEWRGHTPIGKKFVNCGTSELAQWSICVSD